MGAEVLSEVVDFLNQRSIQPTSVALQEIFRREKQYSEDLNEVKGQEHVKQALEIATTGDRNIIMIGPDTNMEFIDKVVFNWIEYLN